MEDIGDIDELADIMYCKLAYKVVGYAFWAH